MYVPAQYDGIQPACLMVFQDGHAYVDETGQFRVPVVFDNLIHRGEMPVTIGLVPENAATTIRSSCFTFRLNWRRHVTANASTWSFPALATIPGPPLITTTTDWSRGSFDSAARKSDVDLCVALPQPVAVALNPIPVKSSAAGRVLM